MTDPIAPQLPASWPASLPAHLLVGMRRGVEREALRVRPDGFIAKTPHPPALGSALTHPAITTDYSEALLELITAPMDSIPALLAELTELHQVVLACLPEGEQLWPLSMPCLLDAQDADIPLAQYGNSPIGRLKTLYRQGLGLRYGRRMQTIAGVHYNLSFPPELFAALQQQDKDPKARGLSLRDYTDQRYFGLIRNFIRLTPMVIALLGASPAVCACFLKGRDHHLQPLEGQKGTLTLPNATALRMGNLGYQNSTQRELGIHYNTLPDYVHALQRAVGLPHPAFAALGTDDATGAPQQINDHVLQIENEYYSLIRPKQVTASGEKPAQALLARGVQYIELRALDVDPASPVGLHADTAAWLETLALYCLLKPSPALDGDEENRLLDDQRRVVDEGRNPDLTLSGGQRLTDWMAGHLQAMTGLAQRLDEAHAAENASAGPHFYQQALAQQQALVHHPDQWPSAQVMAGIRQAGSIRAYGQGLARQHQRALQQTPLSIERQTHWTAVAAQSVQAQAQLETASGPEDFARLLAQHRQPVAASSHTPPTQMAAATKAPEQAPQKPPASQSLAT